MVSGASRLSGVGFLVTLVNGSSCLLMSQSAPSWGVCGGPEYSSLWECVYMKVYRCVCIQLCICVYVYVYVLVSFLFIAGAFY